VTELRFAWEPHPTSHPSIRSRERKGGRGEGRIDDSHKESERSVGVVASFLRSKGGAQGLLLCATVFRYHESIVKLPMRHDGGGG
jgi:hypothetical protein